MSIPENETEECACCCDSFNQSNRAQIKCLNETCTFVACKECVRTYLTETAEAPHCMNCKAPWNDRFMVAKLNASFVNKQYRDHRKTLLLERQVSMLAETMPAVEQYQKKQDYKKFEQECKSQIKELQAQINDIHEAMNSAYRQTYFPQEEERKKFILPCPDEDCRGFLSSAYKCEVCKYYACSKCLVLTGKERNDESHTCDEELVKTAQLIRDSTKPCPKCGERIMKASGCDQMWCTQCHTAFSWRTGKIDHGHIHNPHFSQFQAGQLNGLRVRNPGDVVCGGLPNNWWSTRNTLREVLMSRLKKEERLCHCTGPEIFVNIHKSEFSCSDINKKERIHHFTLIEKFSELFQVMRHINGHDLPRYRGEIQDLNNHEQLRIKYLVREISKDDLGKEVAKRDKKRRKLIEIMHIYELMVAVGNDLIQHLTAFIEENRVVKENAHKLICEELTKKFAEFDSFLDYVNNQFKIISATYSQTVIQIDKEKYEVTSTKFKVSDIGTFA